MKGISTNRILAGIALLCGVLALFIGAPTRQEKIELDMRQIAYVLQTKSHLVPVAEVADALISGRPDFRLIDLRSEAEYEKYHIPGALRLSVAEILGMPRIPYEKVILYAASDLVAAENWMLLYGRGMRNVYLLEGGLDAWKAEILFPTVSPEALAAKTPEIEKKRSRSEFFGGRLRTVGANGALPEPEPAMPENLPELSLPPAKPIHESHHDGGC